MSDRRALTDYHARRDFRRTREPKGEDKRRDKGRFYAIQKHDARRLHYDLRLEHAGVLLSWAITKGPSFDPSDKRLAVRTEDHPFEYGDFEGTIPKGEYGGGTVMLWDRGTWEPTDGDVDAGLENGKLSFEVRGERLEGKWALVRMNGKGRRGRASRENWLLIKERDEAAREDGDPTKNADSSVKTGRAMAEIAEGDEAWRGTVEERRAKAKHPARKGSGRLPAFVAPQLATLVEAAPEGDDWLHEIKYDGYRALAAIAGGRIRISTRNGKDWSDRFAPLAEPLAALDCESALLDGEIAVADAKGRTDFGALQKALGEDGGGIGYYLFDLLSLDGEDLRARPLVERKQRLETLLAGLPRNGPLAYSDHVEGGGEAVFDKACRLEVEGIVSKRKTARYRSGRTRSWLKVKCGMGQEFVVIGWRPSEKAGRPFASLLLGLYDGDTLRYRGRIGSGFGEADLDRLWPELKRRARKTPPVELPDTIASDARFVRPDLVVEVAFRGWTRDGLVRQGSYKGLRGDKPASRIVKERPMSAGSAKSDDQSAEIEGVRVTHPDRVLFPGQGVTKRDLIAHYLALAEPMLAHVRDRPLALVRCPRGREGECFYQKHASDGFPEAFRSVGMAEKSGRDEYLYIDGPAGLVAAVQMGVLELHLWCAHIDKVERPDRLVLDLDPDEGLDFKRVKEAASELRRRLDDLGLASFLLATGGKGLHVVVPLERRHDWRQHKDFAEALARSMAADSRERYTAVLSKQSRKGRIFIDYLRNGRGSSAIAPFSSRAREGAPVAFPLPWSALGGLKDARSVTVETAARRLRRYRSDPWEGYFDLRQRLPKAPK